MAQVFAPAPKKAPEIEQKYIDKAKVIFEIFGELKATDEEIQTVAKTLKKYDIILTKFESRPIKIGQVAEETLRIISHCVKDKEAVLAATNCINRFDEPRSAAKIAKVLSRIADLTSDKEAVKEASNWFSEKTVIECLLNIQNIEPPSQMKVHDPTMGDEFSKIFNSTRNKDAFMAVINCMSKLSNIPNAFNSVALSLGAVSYREREDKEKAKEEVIKAAKFLLEFKDRPKLIENMCYLIKNSSGMNYNEFGKKHKEVLNKLKEHYNITFFGRYSWDCLKELYNNIGKRQAEKPLFVIAYPKDDWNGSFYHNAEVIDSLREHYDVRIFESKNEDQFLKYLRKMNKDYGDFDNLIIGGHGSQKSVYLAPTFRGVKKAFPKHLDTSDDSILKEIAEMMNPGSSIIFQSCSTGDPTADETIARKTSKYLENSLIFAPDTITGFKKLLYENGNVKQVLYRGDREGEKPKVCVIYFRGENVTDQAWQDATKFLEMQEMEEIEAEKPTPPGELEVELPPEELQPVEKLEITKSFAYPSPFKPAVHERMGLQCRINQEVETARYRIFTIAGELVDEGDLEFKEIKEGSAVYEADITEMAKRVASGVYIYVVTTEKEGKKELKRGKFAIIK